MANVAFLGPPAPPPGPADAAGTLVKTVDLRLGFTPRSNRENPLHVDALVEAGGAWPPILVHRSTMTVIDGTHRLAAAKRLGLAAVPVRFFEGTDEDARIEAIRANTSHGLPLTLDERRQAARSILDDHPDWSDRRIADVCGLSPKTVGALRSRHVSFHAAPSGGAEMRIGKDGRHQSVRRGRTRERVEAALALHPDASLRTIAAMVSVSPETVRTVRRRPSGVCPPDAGVCPPDAAPARLAEISEPKGVPARRWSDEAAYVSTPERQRFARWFEQTDVAEDVLGYAEAVPVSRLYEVLDEAVRRASAWESFAQRLRERVR